MKKGCLIYLLVNLALFIVGAYFFDDSGFYKVTNQSGAKLHSSTFVSDKDIIGAIPFDTIVKIETINSSKVAEISINGQKIYLDSNDLTLVEKSNDLMIIGEYICYVLIIIIAIVILYKYLKNNHVYILAQLKAGIYAILSIMIICIIIYAINNNDSPCLLDSKGKTNINSQYTINGYTLTQDTEVDVLCYIKYDYLIRDPKGNQLTVPTNKMKARINHVKEFNNKFTYNIRKEQIDSYLGQNIRSFEKHIGSYIYGINNIYDYPYLIAIENGERIHGLKLLTDNSGKIIKIEYNKEKSENIFTKLPFYETIACKNLYFTTSITGDNSIWERLFAVFLNFLILGTVVFVFARTTGIAFLWSDRNSTSVNLYGKICSWIILSPFLYILTLALLDFYHSMWILVVLYLVSLISMIYGSAINNTAKSIYKCPSCKKNGVYNPEEEIQKEELIGTRNYNWRNSGSINGVKVPQKTCTKKITYKMKGSCKYCGYIDHNIYTREVQVTSTTNCPQCGTRLTAFVNDNMYHEKCPSCHYTMVIKAFNPDTSNRPINRNNTNRNNTGNECEKNQQNSKNEISDHWKREAKENKEKANMYYSKYIESLNKKNDYLREAESYKNKAESDSSYYNTMDDYIKKADFYMSEAEKYYDKYQFHKDEEERCLRNSL